MSKTQCPFDIELHREIWEQGYRAAEEDLLERLAKFYPELDYTFRSYMLQDFPELEDRVKDIE